MWFHEDGVDEGGGERITLKSNEFNLPFQKQISEKCAYDFLWSLIKKFESFAALFLNLQMQRPLG